MIFCSNAPLRYHNLVLDRAGRFPGLLVDVIPTMILFKGGKVIDQVVGAAP
jgi:hypothetical protein